MERESIKKTDRSGGDEPLFEEFEAAALLQWRAEVDRLLKGVSFEKRLLRSTYEGFTLKPIYTKKDLEETLQVDSLPGFPPYLRGAISFAGKGHEWAVAQEFDFPVFEEANRFLLEGLRDGISMGILKIDRAGRSGVDPDSARKNDIGSNGLSVASADELGTALCGVDLVGMPIVLEAGSSGLPFLGFLVAAAAAKGMDLSALEGAVAMDPLGELCREGSIPFPLEGAFDEMAEMTAWTVDHAKKLGTVWVHGEVFSEAGAHAVQELAFTLSTAVAYLRALEARGLELEKAAPCFRFSFSAGARFFMEVAKLRAARVLWNRALEACGVPMGACSMRIHVRTSKYNKTKYDPYVNMLRATTEVFAGITGGADSICAAPFDEPVRSQDAFSCRIARNIQLLLREESHLDRVIDPAGGSWFVEGLTGSVARSSWKLFQTIEGEGGMVEALKKGFIRDQILKTAAKRAEAVAVLEDVIVGTNRYPNALEEPLEPRGIDIDLEAFRAKRAETYRKLKETTGRESAAHEGLGKTGAPGCGQLAKAVIEAAKQGATVGEIGNALPTRRGEPCQIVPIESCRAAEPFERLRFAVKAHQEKHGPIEVFLATLGLAGRIMPRLDFAASFFETGGFAVLRTGGFERFQEAADAALASSAPIVVITGRDEDYPASAPAVAARIKGKKPEAIVILAGLPKDEELVQTLRDAGVDLFIHQGIDLLKTLADLAAKVGVER